jgi:hypothetical protein
MMVVSPSCMISLTRSGSREVATAIQTGMAKAMSAVTASSVRSENDRRRGFVGASVMQLRQATQGVAEESVRRKNHGDHRGCDKQVADPKLKLRAGFVPASNSICSGEPRN